MNKLYKFYIYVYKHCKLAKNLTNSEAIVMFQYFYDFKFYCIKITCLLIFYK